MRHPVNVQHDDDRTFGQRLADKTVAGIGTWAFLIVQASFIIAWIVLVSVCGVHLDNKQLTILNLILSCQAAVTGPLLLLAGNRQARKDRDLADHDYQVNQQTLELLREAREMVADLHVGKAPPK